MRDREAEHIKSQDRTDIRYSLATSQSLARKFGVAVATIRAIRASAVRNHPARIAALARRVAGKQNDYEKWFGTDRSGSVSVKLVPASELEPVVSLHTEGGVDLPHTLA